MSSELNPVENIDPEMKSPSVPSENDLKENNFASPRSSSKADDEMMAQWTAFANLLEVRGMSLEMAELLQEADIKTVKELSDCIPENLHQRLMEANEKHHLLRIPPKFQQVMEIIVLAKYI